MTKIVHSKSKLSRSFGFSIWGRPNDAVHKRNYRPGQHGRGVVRKISDFKKQCSAQRAMKAYYVMQERQFRKFYREAYRRSGNTSDNLVGMLESRLSSVLYNSGLVPTIFAARQFVSHKHVTVNGSVVNRSSYLVKPGDVVALTDSARSFSVVKEQSEGGVRPLTDYVKVDSSQCSIEVLRVPSFSEVPYPGLMRPQLVVELYSK